MCDQKSIVTRLKCCIAELLLRAGTHTHFVETIISDAATKQVWAPLLTEVQQYGTSNLAIRLEWNYNLWFLHETYYSVAYFDYIAMFEALYCWNSIKGGAYTCLINIWCMYEVCTSLSLTEVEENAVLRIRWCTQNTQRNNTHIQVLYGNYTCIIA